MDVDKLIVENIPLINLMIKQLHCSWKTNDEYQEYYDNGLEGLIKGAKLYDESKGKASTYLSNCIANSIKRVFYLNSMPKRNNPSGTDISLNYLIRNDNKRFDEYTEFGDLIPDPDIDIEKEVEDKLLKERLLNAINNLKNEKDKLAIKLYYGLDGYEQLDSYEAVALRMGVTREMIRVRLDRAKKKLREYLKKHDRDVSIKEKEKIYPKTMIYGRKENELLMDELFEPNEEKKKTTTLQDLNSVLFAQIDRLNDDKNDFEQEIRKSYAISQLAQQIVANTNTQIKAVKLMKENEITDSKELEMLGINK
jgi:RNA polymerase sigma factor (sigma-70 family)